jgi:hypothetical protein
MQLRFFAIPVLGGAEPAAELNSFLAQHRILQIERQLIADGAGSFWAVCVTFDEGGTRPVLTKRGKIDFKSHDPHPLH